MSKNRIGIEVQVEFPTIAELRQKLAEKWSKVKDGFDAKINVDVDQNSLKRMKTKIQDLLDDKQFYVNLDFKDAIQGLEKVNREIDKIDAELKKSRSLKINVEMTDLDKSFREVFSNAKKTESALKDQTDEMKKQKTQLDAQVDAVSKFQRIQKELKDGTIATTMKWTENKDMGSSKSITLGADGRLKVEQLENQEKALKEIETILKRIHKIELEQVNAGDEHYKILEKERNTQKEQLGLLEEQYKEKHRLNSLDDNSIKELKRQQDINLELKMTTAFKKQQAEEEQEIHSAISKVAQLESKKMQLAKQIASALESEKRHLQEQYDHYNKIQSSLVEKYSLTEKMTDAQKESLDAIGKIANLEMERTRAKKQQQQDEQKLSDIIKEQQDAEKQALKNMLGDLREIHKVKMQLVQIEGRLVASGKEANSDEKFQLDLLNKQLSELERISQETANYHTRHGQVTAEMQRQLDLEESILSKERQRVQEIAEHKGQQDTLNAKLKEYADITRDIGQLQRDMIFAGMREQNVIEEQIIELKKKQNEMREGIELENKMTDAVKQEINAIQRAQDEQLRLNRLRQDAREVDSSLNDTHGVIDPYSFYSNARQGAMAMFEPIQRLDEALIGVTKVADATDFEFAEFAQGAYDAGSALGVTADQYILATEKWVTAGKSFSESQELAQKSMVGAFVGNIAPDDMVKYMSVPLVSFRKDGLEANDIINVMNETANNHAIEMTELGKAYVRSANTAKDAGVSFNELTAMITGAQEATRKGGERIGTGIKSIALNLTNMNAQLTGQNENKFAWFQDIGVDFRDANGEMLSMTEILGNLHSVWDTLNTDQKGTAKFYMAGKEHAETLGAIIDQWDTSIASTLDGANAQLGLDVNGSAYLEHAKQADSVKFKLAELKNAWDEMMFTLGGGQHGVAKVLGMLTEGLEYLNELAQNEQLMKTFKYIFAGVAIHAGANAMKRFQDVLTTGFGSFLQRGREVRRLMTGINTDVVNTSKAMATGAVVGGVVGGKDNSSDDNKSKGSTPHIITTGSRINANGKNNVADNDKETESINKKTRSVKGFGQAVVKSAGFLPILGDALIILELMGVPVFEKMGNLLSGLTTSTEEWEASIIQAHKTFMAKNGVTNGKLEKKDKELNGTVVVDEETGEPVIDEKTGEVKKQGGIVQQWYDGELNDEGDGQKYLSQEEFFALADRINKFADENGIVDVNLQINDPDAIGEALDKLQEKLNELKASDVRGVGVDIQKQESNIFKANEKIGEKQGMIEYLDKQAEEDKKIIEMFEKKMRQGEELSVQDSQILEQSRSSYEIRTKAIEEANADIKKNQEIIKKSMENIETNASELAQYIGAGGDISHLTDGQAISAMKPMVEQYDALTKSLKESEVATSRLVNGQSLMESQWQSIKDAYPEYASITYSEIEHNDELRASVGKTIGEREAEKKKQQEVLYEAVTATATKLGLESDIQSAMGETLEITGDLKDEIDSYTKTINEAPETKTTKWTVEIWEEVKTTAKSTWGRMKKGVMDLLGSVSTADPSNFGASPNTSSAGSGGVGVGGVSSASVSSGGDLIKTPTQVASVNNATSTKEDPNANARVSSDIWRYWGTEMKIEDFAQSINDLTRAIHNASENEAELIKLYKNQNNLLKSQEGYYKTLSGQKQTEMTEVLKQLRGHGFKTSGNDITNLAHSKSFKGDKATAVEELLNTWKTLGTEMTSISDSIASLNETIKENNEAIKQAEISKEIKAFESTIKRISSLQKKVANSNSIHNKGLSLIGANDAELNLIETEKAMNASKTNMAQLIDEFNKLSKATINHEENGEALRTHLESLAGDILSQSDAILEYRKSINDLEFNRVTKDLQEFNKAIDSNSSKIDNNIKNLQEGLLSGTGIDDLQSYTSSKLNLNRNNEHEALAQQRIDLEKEVQEALDAFARKNVDRERNVANAQLDITASKYNAMLAMQKDYSAGNKSTANEIKDEFDSLFAIGLKDEDYTFVKEIDDLFQHIVAKQDALTKKFNSDLEKAMTSEEKENLTNRYIISSLKIQEDYLKASIEASRNAIDELKTQLKDSSLTDEQENAIKQSIESYEQSIIDAQNSIKETIKERFEFEFSLIEEAVDEYRKLSDELEYAMSIIDSIGGDNNASRGALLSELFEVEKARNSQIAESLQSLQRQLNMYEEGSYEWEIINAEVEEYKQLLKDSNKELLDMNKNIMSNSFDGTISRLEKELFEGKSLEQFERQKELWMEGLEREIALEDTYQRLADLGTQIHDEKMAQLAKQEKLSRYEMDYLNKQLDVLELQQKLENLNKERNVQVLKQQADGTWDWVYEANAEQVTQTQKELQQKQLELQQMEEEARKEYLSKLDELLTDAESGQFDSIEDFQKAMDELGLAFESIVGDFPQIQDEYLQELIDAYSKYITGQEGILDNINGTNDNQNNAEYTFPAFPSEMAKAFKDISKDIGENIANALISKMPTWGKVADEKHSAQQPITITLEKLEFPNVKSVEGFKEAILSLPQLALQKSKEK